MHRTEPSAPGAPDAPDAPSVVADLGERGVLDRIRERLGSIGGLQRDVVVGIGDDAAVLAPARGAPVVVTTDIQIEGVHFDRRYSSAIDVGYRALAVNLSDLAAMGAEPRWALLSLALPAALPIADLEALVDGVAELAETHAVAVIGGNLSRTPGPLTIDITAGGEVAPRRVLTRDGGRPGDALYVSGALGAAAAGLAMLQAGSPPEGTEPQCVARYRRPAPRVRLGLAIGRARAARAAIDLSDGLADAAGQLAEASGCGVVVDGSLVPIDRGAWSWWTRAGVDPLGMALASGDDYELLAAVPRARHGRLRHVRTRVAEPPLTRIGWLTADPGERALIRDGQRVPLPHGFDHWRPR